MADNMDTVTEPASIEIPGQGISVSLTHDTLNVAAVVQSVRSPKAGATVLFAGMTASLSCALHHTSSLNDLPPNA